MAKSQKSSNSNSNSNSYPPPSLTAFPSVTHALYQLPTFDAVPNHMLHPNSTAYSKARMDYAYQTRQQGAVQQCFTALNAYDMRRTPSPAAHEDAPIVVRRQQADMRYPKSYDRR
ncbi:hypothetical protein SCLCIDRAFT_21666 [Scleroderma citrinum Foug A]|uniref:Uncharacterized protein n=1 Tax=Scleroderma citrinum Foug A TaxID=1036808 RepID=A0A0C3E246_9AGAM|nr:hypothetical protein SCLCIDRAFT_21666 [Scleroderma citrinum Foug A]